MTERMTKKSIGKFEPERLCPLSSLLITRKLSLFVRFSRQKSSSMMAVDLNKDLYVIFASGPVGTGNGLIFF